MTGIWRRTSGSDALHNGTILGVLFGAAILWGDKILDFISSIIPESWRFLGEYSVGLYIILIGAIAGYIIDRY